MSYTPDPSWDSVTADFDEEDVDPADLPIPNISRPAQEVFLSYISILSKLYSGTPEVEKVREMMMADAAFADNAEELIQIAGEKMVWTYALIRSMAKRVIAKQKAEEQQRLLSAVPNWGRF